MTKAVKYGNHIVSGTATSTHDSLPFFGGRSIAQVESPELVRILAHHGVPGVNASEGRTASLDRYASYIAGIGNKAADAAEKAWVDLGVAAPGTDVHNGVSVNDDLRTDHIQALRKAAYDRAVTAWVGGQS